jgi:uncharacterized membrane protein
MVTFSSEELSKELLVFSNVSEIVVYPAIIEATVNEGESANLSLRIQNEGPQTVNMSFSTFTDSFSLYNKKKIKPKYVSFERDNVSINASSTNILNFSIQLPEGLCADEYFGYIKLNSSHGIGYLPVKIIVPAKSQIAVSPSSIQKVINVGRSERATLNIKNNGNLGTYVDLWVEGNASDFISFDSMRVKVGAQHTSKAGLTITVPLDTKHGEYTGKITVSSGAGVIEVPISVSVYSMLITPRSIEATITDGTVMNFSLTIQNDLDKNITVNSSAKGEGIKDWSDLQTFATSREIGKFDTYVANFSIAVPEFAYCGVYSGRVHFNIAAENTTFEDSIDISITVPKRSVVTLSSTDLTVIRGFSSGFRITASNRGNAGVLLNLKPAGDLKERISLIIAWGIIQEKLSQLSAVILLNQ